MSFKQELASWQSPSAIETAPLPTVASKAPSSPTLQIPRPDGKPTIITFLRHCGCPFAEKAFRQLSKLSTKYPEISFIAVSHSDQAATDRWIVSVGGAWSVTVIVDEQRELYAQWGLGVSSAWHVLNPWSMYSALKLARDEKIWNKGTESGTRWQTAGSFAVDKEGLITWVRVAKAADDLPDLKEGLVTLGVDIHTKPPEPVHTIAGIFKV